MQPRQTIELSSYHSFVEIEAMQTLPFAIDPMEFGRYSNGDPVILHSADGIRFIGHVSNVQESALRIHVTIH